MSFAKKIWAWAGEHQLASFIAVAIVLAVIMTFISLKVYIASGAMKLDMSRPGYEQARKEVTGDSAAEQQAFPASGALNESAIKDFRGRLDKQQKDLQDLGDFGGETLTDENLGL